MLMKKVFYILLLVFTSSLLAQQSRLNSMGGISYSVLDVDSRFDIYNFGENPAWLPLGRTQQRLEINPSAVVGWGNYHRRFEADGISNYDASFVGFKPLGASGTFKGAAYYNYDVRRGYNRSLIYNPYSGASYRFTDTTRGNFRYNGPTFEFSHGIRLYKNLFFGATVNYQILDGLKDVYTYAQTLYRNVSGKIGLAYKFSDSFALGFYYSSFDVQERIEASDVNLLTVRTYLYRGEKYKIELRGSSPKFKIKSEGASFNFQAYWKPGKKFEVGFKSRYFFSRDKFLFPRNSLIDDEDGYASFGKISAELRGRWIYSDKMVLGLRAGFKNDNSWTKNSKLNLLVWKWKLSEAFAGAGASYSFGRLLFAGEYEAHFLMADSNKYIDHIFNSPQALNHVLRIGTEYMISNKFALRAGIRSEYLPHDFVYGKDKTFLSVLTLGSFFKLSDSFELEPELEYIFIRNDEAKEKRDTFGFFVTLRFYEF